jgi:hypothetical protein
MKQPKSNQPKISARLAATERRLEAQRKMILVLAREVGRLGRRVDGAPAEAND